MTIRGKTLDNISGFCKVKQPKSQVGTRCLQKFHPKSKYRNPLKCKHDILFVLNAVFTV